MKKISVVLLVSVLILVMAACGGKKNETASPSASASVAPSESASSPAAPTASSEPPKDVTLKLGLPQGYDVTNKQIIDGFQAKFPHIKLDIDTTPWGDFVSKIPAQIAGGTAPDVWFQENAVILGYAKKGVAADLTDYIKNDLNAADYAPALFAAKGADGKIYGIPHGLNPIALAYNKKLFTEANVPFPTDNWTYQDMMDAAKKLTKKKGNKTEVYGFISGTNITGGWFPWIKAAGGSLLDSTKTKATFTDPKSLDGLAKWAGMAKDGSAAPWSFTNAIGSEWQAFGSEKGAMYFVQYNLQVLFNKNFPNLDWDTVKVPIGFVGKRTVPNIANSWLIYSKAKPDAKEAAWQFLKYYLSEEAQDMLAVSGASLPVKISSYDKITSVTTAPANKKAFTEGVIEAGEYMDENPSWNEWVGAAYPVLLDVYKGNVSVEAGAKEAQDKVQAIIDADK